MVFSILRPFRSVTALAVAAIVCGGTAQAAEQIHVVKRSDTLSEVARQHGVSAAAVARRNHLKNVNLLRPGQRLIIPGTGTKDIRYTVKKGDSAAAIASQYGIALAALVKRNSLDHPERIVPGQTLVIPGGGTSSRSWDLPGDAEETLAGVVTSKRWKYIVIHHSASREATPKSMDRHHRSRGMENGLAYHFVIGNGRHTRDGDLYIGHRWTKQLDGGHLASLAQNQRSIGICLIGDFNQTSPTRKQMATLRGLIGYLMDRCDVAKERVVTHQQINTRPTECPGKHFPKSRLLAGF